MKKIAIFASGSGSNAENIARHFAGSSLARVSLIVSDNSRAYVLERAASLGIASVVIPRREWREDAVTVMKVLNGYAPDYIVLAGFLSLVPPELTAAYAGRIINVHPALLPSYGGRGMYGENVHRAVVAAGEKESGITVHHVNDKYDDGAIIAQYRVAVTPDDTPETLAAKVHELEYRYFPQVIEDEIRKFFGAGNSEI
ncbi:MAG: phosphoribosylglycinamide formyltransferase [Rikenellaceae bacterium]|nr:phosphoribosylglycinamide formyltransferase [Rikenellaceae bacterium]